MPKGAKTWGFLKEFLDEQLPDVCFLTNRQLRIITRCEDARTGSDQPIQGVKPWAEQANYTHSVVKVRGQRVNLFARKN